MIIVVKYYDHITISLTLFLMTLSIMKFFCAFSPEIKSVGVLSRTEPVLFFLPRFHLVKKKKKILDLLTWKKSRTQISTTC